jgi:hypothetical protein
MPVVKTTNLFSNNEQITSAKLNNIMVNSSFDSGAVVSGQGLEITVGGQMQIKDLDVTTAKIADANVTTAKIADSNVTTAKIADSNVTTAKIADANITVDKLASDAVTTVKILDANVTPAKLSQPLTLSTAQNSTSGTSIDFTSIPSWVKRVTITLNGVSTNGSSSLVVRIGSGGITTTGYSSIAGDYNGNSAITTTGFILQRINAASYLNTGVVTLTKLTGDTWIAAGVIGNTDYSNTCSGSITLSGAIDQVRVTSITPNTFDAGSINIMYE